MAVCALSSSMRILVLQAWVSQNDPRDPKHTFWGDGSGRGKKSEILGGLGEEGLGEVDLVGRMTLTNDVRKCVAISHAVGTNTKTL